MSSGAKVKILQFALFAGMPLMFGGVYYLNIGRGTSKFVFLLIAFILIKINRNVT